MKSHILKITLAFDCIIDKYNIYDAKGAEEVGIDFLAVTYGFGFKKADDTSCVKNIGVCHDVRKIYDRLQNDFIISE